MFGEIAIKVWGIRFSKHVLDPSRAFEGLQMKVPNANGGVGWFRQRQSFVKLLSLVTRLPRRSLARRRVTINDFSAHFTEPDPVTLALAPTGNRESVAIFQPFAFFAAWQF